MATTQGKKITCSAAVVKEFKKPLTIETIVVDVPQAREVRVKMVAVGVCHTDHVVQQGKDPTQPLPFVIGHEGAGVVESVGEGVTSVQPGDKVLTVFLANCQKCKSCKGTRTNICEDGWGNEAYSLSRNTAYGGKPRFLLDGKPLYHMAGSSSFSEYVVCPESSCVKINPKAPLDKVCLLACGYSTGYGSSANAIDILPGDNVAVWGLGGVGLAAVAGAKSKGPAKLIGIDFNNDKEELARNIGITDFINPKELSKPLPEALIEMTDGGLDFAVVCVANSKAMETAVQCINTGGTMVIVGFGDHTPMNVNPMEMIFNRKIKGSFLGDYKPQHDLPKLVDKYLEGKLPLDEFITHTYKLEQLQEAIDALGRGTSIRSVVLM